ncbi:hypothetical protein BDR07DRAFT_1414096 [Suillus spraguei]|nr:hypothetical protein BDR07DRAFT_1441379 [Suillus spraguei]KAG2359855.1 hypothetical protein BDR07DRAFT_1414096 [Suillus spraguei]
MDQNIDNRILESARRLVPHTFLIRSTHLLTFRTACHSGTFSYFAAHIFVSHLNTSIPVLFPNI